MPPSYPTNGLDGQHISSLSSKEAAEPTSRGQGMRRSRLTPSSAARIKTPEGRRETSQQHQQPPLPPDYPHHPSISSSGGAGRHYGTHSRPRGVGNRSSATWTSSSDGGGGGGCDLANLSDTDEVQDRSGFVAEYNRLAGKHGIRPFTPIPNAYSSTDQSPQHRQSQPRRTGWFSRTFLRQPSTASSHASANASTVIIRPSESRRASHKRSMSDLAIQIMQPILKRDTLKGEDLQSLVRLCGKSILYLPSEYAPGSLVLPTCLRATAQYLIQHAADTRGVFRIPGSVKVVSALYDYYCAEGNADDITSTIRCPNLPLHIKATTHDVASTFKRLLSGLPGGILGSLSLLDAMVAIHSQLNGDPELTRTKQTKLRARLIALAIGTVESQFRRELICAVFGLLCLIGRAAETAPREDDHGRPLPTADLMGYNALGIVFGPLLASDLLNSYTMRLAHPSVGLVLFPVTPPNVRKERRRSRLPSGEETSQHGSLIVDKIHVANSITEMLITHWREVVKHMRSLDILRPCATERGTGSFGQFSTGGLRPSASESFVKRKPVEWSARQSPCSSVSVPKLPLHDMSESPVPPSPTPETRRRSNSKSRGRIWGSKENGSRENSLIVQRQRPKLSVRSASASRAHPMAPSSMLSPTAEETGSLHEVEASPGAMAHVIGSHHQHNGYGVPPLMYRALPMEVPPLRTHPDDQSKAAIGGNVGDYIGEAQPGADLFEQGSVNEAQRGGDSSAPPGRRRTYSQTSRGTRRNFSRSNIPEPTTPRYNTAANSGGHPRPVLPKAREPSDGQLPRPTAESRERRPGKRSSFRLRKLSGSEDLQGDEKGGPSKDPAIYNAARSQRRERRLARRSGKGTRSSRSSHDSTAQSGQPEHQKVEEHYREAGGSEVPAQTSKGLTFPNWKHHHHKSERSSEATKLDAQPRTTQLSTLSKNKMRLSFHLRKSASESGAVSQERPRGTRSKLGSRSEDQHQHEHTPDYISQHQFFATVGKRYSETSNDPSALEFKPAEVPKPPAAKSLESQIGFDCKSPGASTGMKPSGGSTRDSRGTSGNDKVQGSQSTSRDNPATPSKIPLRRGRVSSRPGMSRGDVKGNRGELSTNETGQNSHLASSSTGQPNEREEIPASFDPILGSGGLSASRTASTPPRSAHKDINRVKTPTIPTRTSSVNRNQRSPIRKTPFLTVSQLGPSTPTMDSPTRRPRGQTGSSVKAMAAMFESRNTNSPSPLKPPVPVFGIPTPIVQQKNARLGASLSKRKTGSSSSVVGEYTINPVSPPSRLRKSQTTGDALDKPFSLSPTKRSSGTRTVGSGLSVLRKSVDSTASAEQRSERSWVTVVPISGAGAESNSQSVQKNAKATAMEDGNEHSFETVSSDKVATHPAWKDSDVFRAANGDTSSLNNVDKPDESKQLDEDDSESVLITRSHESDPFEPSSELGERRGSQNRGRRVPSVVSTGKGSEKRVVSTVIPPTLLGTIVNRSLSGKKSGSETPMKGAPAEPEVDLSTAVASMSPRPHSGSWDGEDTETRYHARVETDLEEDTSEMRKVSSPQEGVEGQVSRDDFVLPAQLVDFSDLDMEIQQHQSQSGMSTSRRKSHKTKSRGSGASKSKSPVADSQPVSPAAMEVPYSLYEPLGTPRGRAKTYAVPLKDKADKISAERSTMNLPSLASDSRKTVEATNNGAPQPSSPRSVRGSASNIALHAQIRNLQRQLDQRTEEVKQLRRCLDTKENPKQNTDICTLMEKLAETEQECRMWRERAEAAERRVEMFKKITARVRNRRFGAPKSEKKDESHPEGPVVESHDGGNDDVKGKEKAKEELWEPQLRQSSNEMHTEDEGAVADRIRAALHGQGGKELEQGVGQGMDGEYSFPADQEGEHEGVWLDLDTKTDDDGYYDESSDTNEEGDIRRYGQEYEQPSFESNAKFGSPSRHNSPGPQLSQRHQHSSSGKPGKYWWDYYMNRPDEQDTRSEILGWASTSSLVRGGHLPGVDTGAGPIDAKIDDDNRSSTTGSPPGTARTYKSALLGGLEEQVDSGMGVGDGERLSGSSAANMWIRAVEREEFVYSDERAGEADVEPVRGGD